MKKVFIIILMCLLLTNMVFLILSTLIGVINKGNKYEFISNLQLLKEVHTRLNNKETALKIINSNEACVKKILDVSEKFCLIEKWRCIYSMNVATDIDVLQFLGFEDSKIDLIQEKVKPFIKLEELRLRLDTIFFVGSLVHFIFSMVYVFCLFTR